MSSATSTETVSGSDRTQVMASHASTTRHGASDGLIKPWQFFLLAGMLGATATVIVATGQSPASIVTLSLTIVAAGLAGLGLYHTLVPLVSPEAAQTPVLIGGRTRAALEREKALVLRSIKELEFDRAMGKIAQADFDEMSTRLRSRAIGLMRQLEDGEGYRQLIERELQARLKQPAGAAVAQGREDADRARAESEPALPGAAEATAPVDATAAPHGGLDAVTCAACGVANDLDARFCKGCGARLA